MLRGDEEPDHLAEMLPRQVGSEKRGCLPAWRKSDELAHALLDLGPDSPELFDVANRRGQAVQTVERILPHLVEAGPADPQDRIEQRAALQAQCTGAGAQRPQEKKPTKPLMVAAKFPQTGPEFCLLLVLYLDGFFRVGEKGIANEIVLDWIVPAHENYRQSPGGALGVSAFRPSAFLVGVAAV